MTGDHDPSSLALIRSLAAAMRAGLRDGAVARMIVPPRETARDASGNRFISMPAISPDYDLYINKVATIVAAGVPGRNATVTATVPMFAAASGRYLGALDGTLVTNLKCAAVTALVTGYCAVRDGGTLAIIGSGVQARQQYLGVAAVRDVDQVRVFSPSPAHAAAFAADVRALSARDGRPVRVTACASAEQASADADILITATTSTDPLPISARLPAHVHVNCVGGHTTTSRELTPELLAASVLIVEDRRTAIAEAGPLHAAALELDELESRAASLPGQRTVFASTGCAYLDLMTCAHLMAAEAATPEAYAIAR